MILDSEAWPELLDKGEHFVQIYYLMTLDRRFIISKEFYFQSDAYAHFEETEVSCRLVRYTCKARDVSPKSCILDFFHPLELKELISKTNNEGTITKDFPSDEERKQYELWRQDHLLQ
jgi:hypothetical protein